ncbi:hypothetical protein DAY19_09300 [Halobacteriovorax vibrionivorans]|uniref:Bacterial surface antigen (D15) domain-containing protein n=1 Tax=Halobacteriovorax vibrionivorans TaxID=2152716 RepID=A0ABY0IHA6_9BACT|nr:MULTISPECIES: BamA/TamA family outer membrane protein [Halobacteriovorax]RZF21875.1 hypothetical protein DAY19_09300 [Halobacteriovorax vibrionivorans]TGD45840.1 hypothetical protein EP118_14545 [Halobacteriovorax sp. Y22]
MKLQYCIFFLLILNSMTFAQESQRAQKVIEKVSNDSQKGSFVLVPGPSYMPSTKLGLSLIGMYLFDANSGKYKNQDVNVPPSILGAFAKVTTNDSAMGAVGTQLFLGPDLWRISGGYFEGDILSEMFKVQLDRFIDTSNEIRAVLVNVNRRVWKKLFIGFGAVWNEVIFTSEGSVPLGTSNTGFKFNLFYDTRDNTFSPTDGFFLNTRTSFYRKDLGGDDNITTIDASFSQYFSLSDNGHLFSWIYDSSFNLGDTNPNYNYNFGSRGPRGYTGKVFEGANMLRFEGEYKYYFKSILSSRFGLAGFAGVGFVFGGRSRVGNDISSDLFDSDPLAHIGGGIRYKVLPKQNLNMRIDMAYGREDVFTMYFALNEAI